MAYWKPLNVCSAKAKDAGNVITQVWSTQKTFNYFKLKTMARKVYLKIEVSVILSVDDDMEIDKVIEEIDYSFNSGEGFDVLDTQLRDYEVTDSK